MNIDWKAAQYADSSFLEQMSEEERKEFIRSETESYDGAMDWLADMFLEERKNLNKELDRHRHGLSKYRYGEIK